MINFKPTRGILANLFNNITASESFIFGFLNSFNQLIFHEHIWASIIILLGAILTFFYWLFIRNVLIVGEKRFFLENHNHPKTTLKRILLPYKVKATKNTAIVMLQKYFAEWIWYPTIIGGFIKHYEYLLVPYILAENPKINGKKALKLSKEMMKDYKWKLCKFDFSFIGWETLNLFSFNLLEILYIAPFRNCCMANIYLQLRGIAKKNNIENTVYLKDDNLLEKGNNYPKENYLYPEISKKWITTDYQKEYSITSIILMFFSAAIIGWIWEVGLHLFQYGSLVNRGALHGPWLPIYGWGSILLLILLKKTRKNPILTFILAMIICGIVEYGTAWYLETLKGIRYWDYEGYFLNLHGRICLEGLIAFGTGGCAFIYFAAPFLESCFKKIKPNIKIILCIFLIIFYIGDAYYSGKHPNTGTGISQKLETKKQVLLL